MSKLIIEPAVITNHLLLGYACCNSKSELDLVTNI
jgi:hypothetical protein